jgi:hypothetical protein
LYSSSDIIREIKPRMKRVVHVTHTRKMNEYRILVGKSEGK